MDDGRQAAAVSSSATGSAPARAKRSRWPRRSAARFPGKSVEQQVATLVRGTTGCGSAMCSAARWRGPVAGGGAEPDGGILLFRLQGGGRLRGGVAGQHLLAQLGGCPKTKRIGPGAPPLAVTARPIELWTLVKQDAARKGGSSYCDRHTGFGSPVQPARVSCDQGTLAARLPRR
jgi:hypothetical protein